LGKLPICFGYGKLISLAIVKTGGDRPPSGVARFSLGIGLDGYAAGIIGRTIWLISFCLLNLPNKKAPDLDGWRLDD
jgi:hypothetical protein